MTPIRIVVVPDRGGCRRVELRCSCLRVARVIGPDADFDASVEALRHERRVLAPGCRHPWVSR